MVFISIPELEARQTDGVGKIASGHRALSGALQLTHREHAFTTRDTKAVIRKP
jgi:hypothetical protein